MVPRVYLMLILFGNTEDSTEAKEISSFEAI